MPKYIYAPDSGLDQVEARAMNLVEAAGTTGGRAMLDSVSGEANGQAADVCREAVAQASAMLPKSMAVLIERLEGDRAASTAVASMLDGISAFQRENGFAPSADIIQSAIMAGLQVADGSSQVTGGMTLDSIATNSGHNPISLQANRVVTAIYGTLAEASPIATYLPADIGSNEARLAIITNIAGSAFGDYAVDDLLAGTNSGREYTRAERRIALTVDEAGTAATGQITKGAGSNAGVPLLVGRTKVLFKGFPVAFEASNQRVSAPLLSGQIEESGTTYRLSGSVTTATGAIELTIAPALPAALREFLEVEAHIDFEKQPDLAPFVETKVQVFSLFASPNRALIRATPDAVSQSRAEVGVDLIQQAVQATRTQMANERHYAQIRKILAVARNTPVTCDFNSVDTVVDRTIAQGWQAAMAKFSEADMKICKNTQEFGAAVAYTGDVGRAQLLSLPRDIFEQSGVGARPTIYRLGRLVQLGIDVWYTPRGIEETVDSTQFLLVGRSAQVARNPIVCADPLPPTLIPLSAGNDLKQGAALFSRQLTEINPDRSSAMGCALIDVVNLH